MGELKTEIFGVCLKWLESAAPKTRSRALRSLVGRWCSRFGDGAALEAIMAAQRNSPVEPIAYIEKILARRQNGADPRTEAHDRAALARGLGLDQPSEVGEIPAGRVEIDADPVDEAEQ